MKILNLYAGIGGNRKLWGNDHEITAIEYKQEIADIYHDFFPQDKIVVGDAHQYLLDYYKEFDFIWSSPPCPTHSIVRFVAMGIKERPQKAVFPSMKLYEEILFLQHYYKGKFCVENVKSFYKPLIPPFEFVGHFFWTNFVISPFIGDGSRDHHGTIKTLQKRKGFNIEKYKVDKRTILRNCVEPEIGKHILDCALGLNKQKTLL